MAIEIKSVKSYYSLDSWVIANLIQLATTRLCARILNQNNDPCGRQYDQMTQAARSITSNIAEGCSRNQTSRETEMRLLDVARASASELHGDIFFNMLNLMIEPWSKDNPNYMNFINIRLDSVDYSHSWEQNAYHNIIAQYDKFRPWLEHDSLEVALNSMLHLCNRESLLIQRLISHKLEIFRKEGGFREGLTVERTKFKNNETENEGAPLCPKCGKSMVKRSSKNNGRKFWGCTNYPLCNGVINII